MNYKQIIADLQAEKEALREELKKQIALTEDFRQTYDKLLANMESVLEDRGKACFENDVLSAHNKQLQTEVRDLKVQIYKKAEELLKESSNDKIEELKADNKRLMKQIVELKNATVVKSIETLPKPSADKPETKKPASRSTKKK